MWPGWRSLWHRKMRHGLRGRESLLMADMLHNDGEETKGGMGPERFWKQSFVVMILCGQSFEVDGIHWGPPAETFSIYHSHVTQIT